MAVGMMENAFEGIGNLLGDVIGAAKDVFVARESTRAREAELSQVREAAKFGSFRLTEQLKFVAFAMVAVAGIVIVSRRRRG